MILSTNLSVLNKIYKYIVFFIPSLLHMYRTDTSSWYLERVIRLLAGSIVLISTVLAYFISPRWLLLDLVVGLNLIIFSLTGYCVMAHVLHTRFHIPTRID